MSNLETLLDDAIGDLQPSFDLDDVVGQGRRARRRNQARVLTTRAALVLIFVTSVALIGNLLSPVETSNVATQPGETDKAWTATAAAGPARFMKPGPDSGALLHLPTIFDREPLARSDWPEQMGSILAAGVAVWDLDWPERAGPSFISLDLERHTVCILRERVHPAGELGATCISLHDLASQSWALPSPVIRADFFQTDDAVALSSFQHQWAGLDDVLRSVGGHQDNGVVLPTPGTPPQAVRTAMTTLGPLLVDWISAGALDVTVWADGEPRSLTGAPIASCVLTDDSASAQLGLQEGSLLITARDGSDGVIKLDRNSSTITTKTMFHGAGSDASVIVFMAPWATAGELAAMSDHLDSGTATASYEFFDQDDALAEFRKLFAATPDLRNSVTAQDMPASFRFDAPLGAELAGLEAFPGVFDVVEVHAGLELPSVASGAATAVYAMTDDGPVVHGSYEHDGGSVDIVVSCGDDFLDARSTGPRNPPRRSQVVAIADRDRVGTLHIPALGLDMSVWRGMKPPMRTALDDRAVSYWSTPIPGVAGNAAVGAFRSAPVEQLGELVPGNLIIAETRDGRFIYRVTSITMVPRSDLSVLDDFGDDRLTLTTEVQPFGTDERLVVTAHLLGDARVSDVDWSDERKPASLE